MKTKGDKKEEQAILYSRQRQNSPRMKEPLLQDWKLENEHNILIIIDFDNLALDLTCARNLKNLILSDRFSSVLSHFPKLFFF